MSALTIEMNQFPWWYRALNRTGATLGRLGLDPAKLPLPLLDLSADSLLEAARRRTGLTDFGDDSFRRPMRSLVDSLEKDARLHLFGRMAVRERFIQTLRQRLLIQEDLRRFPEIRNETISGPVIILGLPRTGTTLLHHLMAQATRARAPLLWELWNPSPPPRGETRKTDPRIDQAARQLEFGRKLFPIMSVLHPMAPEEPDECLWIFQLTFMARTFDAQFRVPSYIDSLSGADMTPLYHYHRTVLQLLQWKCPGDYWVLKTPFHLYYLDTLLQVYPDARLVFTHRDPCTAVASGCSLWEGSRMFHSAEVDLHEMAREWTSTWSGALERALDVRRRVQPSQFYDLDYARLVANPVAAVKDIHRHFGLPFDSGDDAAMRAWLRNNASGPHSTHRYDLARYGLTREEVKERFRGYMDRRNASSPAHG